MLVIGKIKLASQLNYFKFSSQGKFIWEFNCSEQFGNSDVRHKDVE